MTIRRRKGIEPLRLWERQPGESAKAFAAFQTYRDQPPAQRSIRRVAQEWGKSGALAMRWSSRHRWVDRVTAWDAEQDRLLQALVRDERKAFAKRLAASGALMQARGLSKVRSYVDRFDREGMMVELRPGQSYVDQMSVLEAIRLIVDGARLEALGRGLPGDQKDEEPAPANVMLINPIVAALTLNPLQTAEAVEAMERMVLALGMEPTPQLTEGLE